LSVAYSSVGKDFLSPAFVIYIGGRRETQTCLQQPPKSNANEQHTIYLGLLSNISSSSITIIIIMDDNNDNDKIAKLQLATDEAEKQMTFCKELLETAEQQLTREKEKYRNLPQEEQEKLAMNETELPELLETQARAKNVYEEVQARYATNKRYLEMVKAKSS
jgi:hypothetical protein